jgi:hypothetical protein
MGPKFLPRAKAVIQSLHYTELEQLAAELKKLDTADEIMGRLRQVAQANFAGLLD